MFRSHFPHVHLLNPVCTHMWTHVDTCDQPPPSNTSPIISVTSLHRWDSTSLASVFPSDRCRMTSLVSHLCTLRTGETQQRGSLDSWTPISYRPSPARFYDTHRWMAGGRQALPADSLAPTGRHRSGSTVYWVSLCTGHLAFYSGQL